MIVGVMLGMDQLVVPHFLDKVRHDVNDQSEPHENINVRSSEEQNVMADELEVVGYLE